MQKSLINILVSLGISPIPSWSYIEKEQEPISKDFFANYLYPMMGATTIAVFFGTLFNKKEAVLECAIKESILCFITLFAAFFISSYVLNKINVRYFQMSNNLLKTQMFVGYISSLSYTLIMIQSLLPELFFIKFANYYILYIIWTGSEHFLKIQDKKRLIYMISSGAILYFIPFFVRKFMLFIMPGLN